MDAPKNNEPLEWQEGQARARAMRVEVAAGLGTALIGRDMTGGPGITGRRLLELREARQIGDPVLLRAAVWEAALAMAAWCVQLDLEAAAAAARAAKAAEAA